MVTKVRAYVTAAGTVSLYTLELELGVWSISDPIWEVLSLGIFNGCSSVVFAIAVIVRVVDD